MSEQQSFEHLALIFKHTEHKIFKSFLSSQCLLVILLLFITNTNYKKVYCSFRELEYISLKNPFMLKKKIVSFQIF